MSCIEDEVFDVCACEWWKVGFGYVCIRKRVALLKQNCRVNDVHAEDAEFTCSGATTESFQSGSIGTYSVLCLLLHFSFCCGFTESQDESGWKGPQWVTRSNLPAQARSSQSTGLCLALVFPTSWWDATTLASDIEVELRKVVLFPGVTADPKAGEKCSSQC